MGHSHWQWAAWNDSRQNPGAIVPGSAACCRTLVGVLRSQLLLAGRSMMACSHRVQAGWIGRAVAGPPRPSLGRAGPALPSLELRLSLWVSPFSQQRGSRRPIRSPHQHPGSVANPHGISLLLARLMLFRKSSSSSVLWRHLGLIFCSRND